MTDQTTEPTVTPDPDRDGVILHLPEITYLDTQTWAVDVGLTTEGFAALRTLLGATPAVPPSPVVQSPIREQPLNAIDATFCQSLGFGSPEGLLAAYEASRTQTVDRAALRETLRRVLAEADGFSYDSLEPHDYQKHVDGVLAAVLPATTNHDTDTSITPPPALTEEGRLRTRVQVLEEDAERDQGLAATGARCLLKGHQGQIESGSAVIEGHRFALSVKLGLGTGAPWGAIHERVAELRRVADETAATETPEWARPETEEEKLTKCRRMAKALSAPPVAPPEWETTTEWPGRHKRPGDRRIHATARFVVNDTQQFWTACGERVGRGGTPMSHMPVDCRGCKRATAAGARQDGADRG